VATNASDPAGRPPPALLPRLFVLHALVTLAAAVVLVVAPAAIPRTVGIALPPDARLLCYLLGACELGVAYLSFMARTITDAHALRVVCRSFVAMHLATALVEVYAFTQGVGAVVWANVALRVVVAAAFVRYGVRATPASAPPA
jgi:hypothetical protein